MGKQILSHSYLGGKKAHNRKTKVQSFIPPQPPLGEITVFPEKLFYFGYSVKEIFLAAASDKVSFGLASDRNGIYGSFSVKLPLTTGTKVLQNHFTGAEAAHAHEG